MDFSFCAVLKFIWHIRCLFLFLHTWLKNNFWLFDNKSKQAHHFFPEWDFKLPSTLSLTEPQERALMIFQWGWLRAVFKTCLFTTFYRGLQTEQHSSASVKWGNNSWKIRVVPARIKQQRGAWCRAQTHPALSATRKSFAPSPWPASNTAELSQEKNAFLGMLKPWKMLNSPVRF